MVRHLSCELCVVYICFAELYPTSDLVELSEGDISPQMKSRRRWTAVGILCCWSNYLG